MRHQHEETGRKKKQTAVLRLPMPKKTDNDILQSTKAMQEQHLNPMESLVSFSIVASQDEDHSRVVQSGMACR